MRDWRVIKTTGWTFEEFGNQPAARVDWLLAVEDAVAAAEQNKQRRQQAKTDRGRR